MKSRAKKGLNFFFQKLNRTIKININSLIFVTRRLLKFAAPEKHFH